MDTFLMSGTSFFQRLLSSEILSFIELAVLSFMLLFLFRFFQKTGLIVFMIVAVLIGNIQIMTEAYFPLMKTALPLGTLAFSTSFLASNILNEHFGKSLAKKAVYVIFFTQVFFGVMMFITLCYESTQRAQSYHQAIASLFVPSLRFFIASLTAYFISQLVDISIFDWLKKKRKALFERSNISMWVSALLDNIIFSFLAFYILAPIPFSISRIIFDCILGTYWLRVLVAFLETPFIYFSYRIKKD